MLIQPYTRNVFYYETDRMDVVSHTNYIRWMEEARISFMDQVGVPYHQIEAEGILLPVIDLSCQYHRSFRFGDRFLIYTRITAYNGFKLSLSYEMYSSNAPGVCYATATSSHCFTNADLRPMRLERHNPALHNAFLDAMQCTYPDPKAPQ